MTSATAADSATSPVLFLTHSFPRHDGDAAGSFILRLARALQEQGRRVIVVTPHARGLSTHDEIQGILVMRFHYAPASMETLAYTGTMAEQVQASWTARGAMLTLFASGFWHLLRARQDLRPALLHAHWWFPSGIIAAALARISRIPLITTMHGSDVRLARTARYSHGAFRWVLSSSKATTAVSRWLSDQAHEMAPAQPAPIVAPMPAATNIFFPAGERDPSRLLFVGRLNTQKGIETLLQALALVRQSASLDVVGGGAREAELRGVASSLGIGDRVRWLGPLPQQELAPLYRRAGVLVVPSREEGLGLVAVEGQLCATPVVAFDSGGLRDIVQHNRTGLLVANQSAEALARAIESILMAPEYAKHLGRAGRESALATFAPEAVARRYATIYREALTPAST